MYHALNVPLCPAELKISKFAVDRRKFQREVAEVPLLLQIPKFSYNAVQDRSKEALMPKISSIRPAVSIEQRLVTDADRQTPGRS